MILNLGNRWAREENKATNDLLDKALELSQISTLMYACGEGSAQREGSQAMGISQYELICSCFPPPLPIASFLPFSPGG